MFKGKTKIDWVIHYIVDSCECEQCKNAKNNDNYMSEMQKKYPFFCNCHTHGLEAHGHTEMVVCIDMGAKNIANLLNSFGIILLENNLPRLEHDKEYEGFLSNGYKIKVYQPENCPVAFIFMPDKQGKFPGDEGCSWPYNKQQLHADLIIKDKGYV
jgi:hypothetical protein